jgi:Fuc2NAc and GlcNAc transferase
MTQSHFSTEFYLLVPAIVGSGVISWFLTKEFLRFGKNLGLEDIPNERSSHHTPTLRGGGVGFVLSLLILILSMTISQNMDLYFGFALFLGSAGVAWAGWIDDRKGLPPAKRLVVHLACAALVAGSVLLNVEIKPITMLLFGLLCTIFLAWYVNLYNFMDGTDALASVQAVTVTFWSAVHCYFTGDHELMGFFVAFGLSVLGFLRFNWPPARVFMGDVGSGFLGFMFGSLALYGHFKGSLDFLTSLLLMSVFLGDSGYTLIVRFFKRKNIFQAHRSHAYQHSVQRGLSHRSLALLVGAFNLFWLGPLTLALRFYGSGIGVTVFISLAPLFLWQVFQRAGSDKAPAK